MTIPTSYFVVQNKISSIMESIQKAGVPDKFHIAFLESLGYKSTNDRAIIAMLKALNFLDSNGIPTENYKQYKNPANSKKILAQQLKDAYHDIFLVNENANELSVEELKGIFATVSGKGDSVALKMAQTFKSFCSLADFKSKSVNVKAEAVKETIKETIASAQNPVINMASSKNPEFHYNIQIHLPATRDITVYNAIFKSLKEHLL